MRLTSPAFKQGESIPSLYTCQGKDINPPLVISEKEEIEQAMEGHVLVYSELMGKYQKK